MNRSFLTILFALGLGLVGNGCNTASPAGDYSSRKAVLGRRSETNNLPISVGERLSGSHPAPAKPGTPQ
ncbi:MAG: hypothetical protein ABSH14_06505 [Verrucomicrobiia bacterium]|jgi:hypothetical protein